MNARRGKRGAYWFVCLVLLAAAGAAAWWYRGLLERVMSGGS
jgi:hypothetical protein